MSKAGRIIALVLTVLMLTGATGANAEQVQAYIICQPHDLVNVRTGPSRKANLLGSLETGYTVWVYGEKKNGFLHCENENLEQGDCWIYAGYIVYEEPVWMEGREAVVVSNARVAARKCKEGKVRKWLYTEDTVKVWWWTSEWCVTNKGFVKTQFLELDGE